MSEPATPEGAKPGPSTGKKDRTGLYLALGFGLAVLLIIVANMF